MKPFYIDFVVNKKEDPVYEKKLEEEERIKRARKAEKKALKRQEQTSCGRCCSHLLENLCGCCMADSDSDEGSKKDEESDEDAPDSEKVHWLYGDLAKRYDKSHHKALRYEQENPGKTYQWEPTDFIQSKTGIMTRVRDWLAGGGGEHDTIEEKIDRAEDIANDYDDTVWWCRFIIVLAIMLLYAANSLGFFKNWNDSCFNDIAIHNYNCMANTSTCFEDFKKHNEVFYCTAKDMLAQNNNFCRTGLCDGST